MDIDLFSRQALRPMVEALGGDSLLWVVFGFSIIVIVWLLAWRKPPHAWRIHKSYRILSKLEQIGVQSGPAAQFGYLRSKSVDPYTFEEAILSALKNHGLKIKRNRRYSGDGGIDGRAWHKGRLILIQAKLYRHHVAKKDVEQFCGLCKRRKALGLFVHSGRTGKGAKIFFDDRVKVVSGERLLRFLAGDHFPFFEDSDREPKG